MRIPVARISGENSMRDKVLLMTYDPTKLQDRGTGPYHITQVHVNGTVTILLAPGVLERINICRVRP